MQYTKTLSAEVHKSAKGFSAAVTVAVVDRDGDVLVSQGMNSKNYERNPVLLAFHDDRALPVGKCVGIRRKDDSIDMDFAFTPRPPAHEGEWIPDMVAAHVDFGSLSAVSIRFAPLEGGVRRANGADVQRYGPECQQVYSKWELLEVSVVPIPANQEALIYAVEKAAKMREAPKPKSVVIPVRVPRYGDADVRQVMREEIAKASGRMWFSAVQ